MAVTTSYQIDDKEVVERFARVIDKFGETPDNPLFKAMRKETNNLRNIIRRRTPKDTGITAKSVQTRVFFARRDGALIGQAGYLLRGKENVGRIIAVRKREKYNSILNRILQQERPQALNRLNDAVADIVE